MKKKLLFLCLPLLLNNAFSQDLSKLRISGRTELLQGELIDRSVRDKNGEICSGIIVLTDLTGFSYNSSNGVVKINHLAGKDFVFLSPDERTLEIFCSGFEPMKIILNEIGINLKSGDVWQIKITGDKRIDQIPITISTNVEGAAITIDGFEKGTEKTQWIGLGKHKLILEKTGYKKIDTEINVTEKNVLFNYTMERIKPVRFTVRSVPAGAKVSLNGIEKGESDYQSFELPGKYTLQVSKQGFLDLTKEIEIKETGTNEFSYRLSRNRGTLIINLNLADAEIKLDGEVVAKREIELAPKSYDIEISRAGYSTIRETVLIKLGETVTKNYTLVKNTILLTIETDPADASVIINNQNYAELRVFDFVPGSYIIEVEKVGYKKQEVDVTLQLNKPVIKRIVLEPLLGSLQVTIKPIDADLEIFKNEKLVNSWKGANILSDLTVGEYKLIARLTGYISEERTVTISESIETKVDLNLRKDDQTGIVEVRVLPAKASDANIYLDEVLKGTAPLSISLMPGFYKLMAKKTGFEDATQEITMLKNGSESVLFNMEPVIISSTEYNRTWNWITTTIAVGSGIAATYFYFDSQKNYDSYKAATYDGTARDLRYKTENSASKFNIAFPICITSLVTSVILWISN